MRLDVSDDAAGAARRAAAFLCERAIEGVGQRGLFSIALSGGRSPLSMFRDLAVQPIPWHAVHLFQVDERVAPRGDAERNFTALESCLLGKVALPPQRVHAMPVLSADLGAAAEDYARDLRSVCGAAPVLDLAQLGLGGDGHTASLVPGDAALAVEDRDVALTAPYQGRRRMTLTYPPLRRARCLLWLVTGAEKAAMLTRLLDGDESIPAGRLAAPSGVVFADAAAARL